MTDQKVNPKNTLSTAAEFNNLSIFRVYLFSVLRKMPEDLQKVKYYKCVGGGGML